MVINNSEQVIWEEKAGMLDFLVYPMHWLWTVLTLGMYVIYTYLVRIYTRYTLTNERLIKESGILMKQREEIELFRIKDTKVRSGLFQRLVGYGDIYVISTDVNENFFLTNMPKANEKREAIRAAANESKKQRNFYTVVNE